MTTDATAARDRAIELVDRALSSSNLEGVSAFHVDAVVAVDALLAEPEVLRALATASDVTADRAAIERVRAVCLGRRNVATVAVLKALGDLRALDGDTTEEER